MQLKCIRVIGAADLTLDRIYEATGVSNLGRDRMFCVRDDTGNACWFPAESFEAVPAEPAGLPVPKEHEAEIRKLIGEAQGIKLDTGKPPVDLVEPEFIEEVARVLDFGARKYDVGNWRKGMALPKVLAGVLRHVYATLRGEHRDPETGLLHVAHAACGLMFAAHYIRTGQLNVPDDRWKREVKP